MPINKEIKSVFIIGSGPIVIGQACEFDYAGVQACKALKDVGLRVILLNSNPATIMTDPEMADSVYIDSIDWQTIDKILAKEKPDALLTTMGGQTALNCSVELDTRGILKKHNVRLIGADREVIEKAEARDRFRYLMEEIGLDVPKAYIANNVQDAKKYQKQLGFPLVVRPSYTLGGSGGGIVFNEKEFLEICQRGFAESFNHEILLEESLLGWKEFELEVIRDKNDNCIVICSIENVDPLGIHTGDSITVAPAQTLTDKQYQKMRDTAILVLKKIGVETGGANVQFAIDPKTGRQVVIEMNPRVSRSSALASKATGFPIAKVAALLSVGFTLGELKNEITGEAIPASFEPTIDYIVTKIPRFNFEKFPEHEPLLTTQMKSVGEVMGIGRTFQSSLQKALNSLELGISGLGFKDGSKNIESIKIQLKNPGPLRLLYIAEAFRVGLTISEINKLTFIDSWFLNYIYKLVMLEKEIIGLSLDGMVKDRLLYWKQQGFSDQRIAELLQVEEETIRKKRVLFDIKPTYKRIDSCAAEFPTETSYLYSSYEHECEADPSKNSEKVIVLGGGPNRIGQGIEFDYCCVKALQALKSAGFAAIMVNCNPATVSTDYDMASRLYFEPVTLESILDIIELEKPLGIILQFGGQTPLKLAKSLHEAKVDILGTSFATIDLAEDRQKFSQAIQKLKLKQPKNFFINSIKEVEEATKNIDFPLVVRPSYVLGGGSMEIVYDKKELIKALHNIQEIEGGPILLDEYLEDAIEVEVDAVCDKEGRFIIVGIMEHIEPAGVHSGDSSCVLPTISLNKETINRIKDITSNLIKHLKIIGFINIQFAIKNDEVYILEVNPRASRAIPFLSKACRKNYVAIATECLLGINLSKQTIEDANFVTKSHYCVKHSIFPFNKFPGTVLKLGPKMRSTGEVMGTDEDFLTAYKKSHELLNKIDLSNPLNVFIACSLQELDKIITELKSLKNIKIYCSSFLAAELKKEEVEANIIDAPNDLISLIKKKYINMVALTNDRNNDQLAKIISKEIVANNILYALTINTARVMLRALKE